MTTTSPIRPHDDHGSAGRIDTDVQVLSAALARIEAERARLVERVARHHRLMMSGTGLNELLGQVATELEGAAVAQDRHFHVVGSSDDRAPGLALTPERRLGDRNVADDARAATGPVLDRADPTRSVAVLTGPAGLVGYVCASSSERLRDCALDILTDCLDALTHGLLVHASALRSEEQHAQRLLNDLLEGRLSDVAGRTMQELGFDVETSYVCLAFGAAQGEALDLNWLTKSVTAVCRSAAGGAFALVGVNADKVIAFVPRHVVGGPEGLARRMLNDSRQGNDLVVGIGPDCRSAAAFAPAAREALWVADVLRHRGVRAAYVHARDLGVVGLLHDHGRTEALSDFVDRWLGALLDYDRKRQSDLIHTLGEFLNRNSLVATAEALHIHVSTLKYRLKRIHEILQIDLADPEVAFNVSLSVRLREGLESLDAATRHATTTPTAV